jgi:purine-binding chemotaxis protein CheW
MNQQEIEATLRCRAQVLGREPVRPDGDQERLEFLAFRLADEKYAIELGFVREVLFLEDLTPVPGTPAFVLGIVNIRGQILSVIDLKEFFLLPRKTLGERDELIVLRAETMEFGVRADSILGTVRLPASGIQTSLSTLDEVRARFLKGVTHDRLIVLDGQKLLSDKGLIVHEG